MGYFLEMKEGMYPNTDVKISTRQATIIFADSKASIVEFTELGESLNLKKITMITMIFFYVHIVKAVVMHEAALKAQAKKMNVESLRSNVSCCQLFVYFLSQLFVYILSFRTKEGRVQK